MTKAELDAQAAFEKMQARLDALPKFARTRNVTEPAPKPFALKFPRGDNDPVCSKNTTMTSYAAKPVVQQYTGTKMLGIGQMHKSNLVPVFSSLEAEEIGKMRRG